MTDPAQEVRDWAAQHTTIDSNLLANVHATLAVLDVLLAVEARLAQMAPPVTVTVTGLGPMDPY